MHENGILLDLVRNGLHTYVPRASSLRARIARLLWVLAAFGPARWQIPRMFPTTPSLVLAGVLLSRMVTTATTRRSPQLAEPIPACSAFWPTTRLPFI